MKKIYIVLICCLAVIVGQQASIAQEFAYLPQALARSQKVDRKDLRSVLVTLEKKFGVYFTFESGIVQGKYVLDEDVVITDDLDETLTRVLKPLDLRFRKLSDKYYTIFPDQDDRQKGRNKTNVGTSLQSMDGNGVGLLPLDNSSINTPYTDLQLTIAGTVTDEAGQPLPGVNVVEKGTTNGTTTDAYGKYTINVLDEKGILVFSFIGYASQEIMINGQTVIDVSMAPGLQALDEVVVVGYGEQKKIHMTGAVSTVTGDQLVSISTPNLSNTLAGRMPGMTIQQVNGRPGSGSSITIRGAAPIYVVDGIIQPQEFFDALDPNAVESISILKDAASAAVYGARASGGVILVTTKMGREGPPKISFKVATSVETPTFDLNPPSAYEHAMMWNDYNLSIGTPTNQSVYFSPDELDEFKNNPDRYPSWFELAWNNPVSQQYNLSVSGGSESTKYFVSAGYYDGIGFVDNIGTKKQNLNVNLETKIVNNLVAELRFNMNMVANTAPMWPNDNGRFDLNNLINGLQIRSRTRKPFVNGYLAQYTNEWNPFGALQAGYINDDRDEYNAIIGLTYNVPFIKGLKLNTRYSQNRFYLNGKDFHEFYTVYNFPLSGGNNHLIADDAQPIGTSIGAILPYEYVRHDNARGDNYQFNTRISYDRDFGKHGVSAVLVYEQYSSYSENIMGLGEELFSTSIPYLFSASAAPERRHVDGSAAESGRLSYIGRLAYNYADKYMIETSFRYDGSEKFPEHKRWGFFPSVSAGWRVSEEPWFRDRVTFADNLKLRGSIGLLGNDNVGRFQYLEEYQLAGTVYYGQAFQGIQTTGIPNYDITWEKSTTYNIGVDFDFLKSFSFTGEVFRKKITDILETRGAVVPGTFGGSMPDENWGVALEKGFEVMLGYRGSLANGFSYSVSGNLGYSIDEVVETFVPENQPDYLNPIGKPRNRILGYRNTGILRTPEDLAAYLENVSTINGRVPQQGWLSFSDVRGLTNENEPDGIVDANDREILSYNAKPRLNYGFLMGAQWKGFRLDVLFQGLGKWDRMLDGLDFMHINPNVAPPRKIDYWTPDNLDGEYPRFSSGANRVHYMQASDFWLRNAAFLRLKQASLSYSLPESITSKLNAENISLSVTGNNLLTWSQFKEYDPEQATISSYPIVKMYTFRLNVTF